MKNFILKNKLLPISLIAALILALGFWQHTEKVRAEDDFLRFHVIAHSDSREDQEVKLKVRDAILAAFTKDLENFNHFDDALAFLKTREREMKDIATETLKKYGFDYGVKIAIAKDEFPTKSYGDLVLSAGEYEAVKIILGEGQGKNWWCVMFPPLCFVDISQNVGVAKLESYDHSNESDIVATNGKTTNLKITSKVLEILK